MIDDEDDINWRTSSLPKGANNEELIADQLFAIAKAFMEEFKNNRKAHMGWIK